MNRSDMPTYRFWGSIQPPRQREPIRAELTPREGGSTAQIRLYDPIDSWGGEWGVSAKEFAAALDDLGRNVDTIDLLINSPGGEVFEGLAILNILRAHPASVNVTVEGIAASAASFVAMAGDRITMARNSQMMIHDASGMAIGNAKTMTDFAELLNKMSDNIADVYAQRTGGSVSDWRAAMSAESWYSADEAVAAGLADVVLEEDAQPTNTFDLTVFNYEGRENAPDPFRPIPKIENEHTPDPDQANPAEVEDEPTQAVTPETTGEPAVPAADDNDGSVDAEIAARLRTNENAALIAFGA